MQLVFVMDGLDRVHPDKDTTYGFIEAALARGHECLHALIHQIDWVGGQPAAVVRELRLEGRALSLAGEPRRVMLRQVEAVLIRKDPPFDPAYQHATLLLEALRGHTLVMNDPHGLREANEKLFALRFARWMPQTIVSSDRATIEAFIAEVGGKAIIKPLDGAGGHGVMILRGDDPNRKPIVDLLTDEGRRLAMIQAFIPNAHEGDKRVLVLDAEPLGAILRVASGGDFRANIHVGGKVVPTELTPREREIVADMGPELRRAGLIFVGLDLVGERLTEVNVTSPTGIRELSAFMGRRVSDDVIAWIERTAG
jgi:glutathione synthase